MTDLPAYYVDRIEPNGVDCWVWTGSVNRDGYGHVNTGVSTTTAHRAVYGFLVTPLERGVDLDHLCRNRACVNPDHLEPVSHAENVRRGHHVKRAQCANGHQEYVVRLGRRVCLGCRREAAQRWRDRQVAA